jgi:hypothetical protein
MPVLTISRTLFFSLGADLIVILHLVYVLFVVAGQAAIILGAILEWQWVRNRLFRATHLASILVVAGEAALGMACPLTMWEYDLRRMAGQHVEMDLTFIGRLARAVIFYDLPQRAFTVIHIAFFALVLLTFILIPPRCRQGGGGREAMP